MKQNLPPRIMLFLGSGTSKPTGLPLAEEITQSILFSEYHEDNLRFYPGRQHRLRNNETDDDPWNPVPHIQKFLRFLKSYVDAYKVARHWEPLGNYEDLYYLLLQLQIERNASGNPAVQHFEAQARLEAHRILAEIPKGGPFVEPVGGGTLPDSYSSLVDKSADFIKDVVCHKLQLPSGAKPRGLDLLVELAGTTDVRLDVATTNHDLLIETVLHSADVEFAGGGRFSLADFSAPAKNVRLVKIHGSLDWYGSTIRDSKKEFIEEDEIWNQGPFFLIGTDNKATEYGFGTFFEVYGAFVKMLEENDLMVMSGYGWNDRGVNSRLLSWLAASPSNRLVLLHFTRPQRKSDVQIAKCAFGTKP